MRVNHKSAVIILGTIFFLMLLGSSLTCRAQAYWHDWVGRDDSHDYNNAYWDHYSQGYHSYAPPEVTTHLCETPDLQQPAGPAGEPWPGTESLARAAVPEYGYFFLVYGSPRSLFAGNGYHNNDYLKPVAEESAGAAVNPYAADFGRQQAWPQRQPQAAAGVKPQAYQSGESAAYLAGSSQTVEVREPVPTFVPAAFYVYPQQEKGTVSFSSSPAKPAQYQEAFERQGRSEKAARGTAPFFARPARLYVQPQASVARYQEALAGKVLQPALPSQEPEADQGRRAWSEEEVRRDEDEASLAVWAQAQGAAAQTMLTQWHTVTQAALEPLMSQETAALTEELVQEVLSAPESEGNLFANLNYLPQE